MRNVTTAGLLGLMSVVLAAFGDLGTASGGGVAPNGLAADGPERAPTRDFAHHPASAFGRSNLAPETLTDVVRRYCQVCHNDALLTGNLSLAGFDVERAPSRPETAEKMILKLRAGMMPPPGMPRPAGDTLVALVEELEARMDAAAQAEPNPGGRTFQRLNQAEYARSIEDLLNLRIDAGDYLPPDTKSANFDNISEAQLLSPTLLDAYMNAANQISRLAIGNPGAQPAERTYTVSGYVSQSERVEGAPYGTRGGVSVMHHFPADGAYRFRIVFEHTTTGEGFFGQIARFEQLEVSINGERVALLDVDQWMHISDPEGISMRTGPVFVRAGPQRVTAAFVKRTEGPVEDLMSPHEWSLADRHTGISGYGLTLLPHLRDLVIGGPYETSGVSETPSRQRIFTCRPASAEESEPCARDILARLAGKAYRRPLLERDIAPLMAFHRSGAEEGGFEAGIRTALTAILASPHFVFRMEEAPADLQPGQTFRIGDVDLASRLSFFLWGAPPDDQLMALAREGALSRDEVLEAQTRRMLADPRAASLGPPVRGPMAAPAGPGAGSSGPVLVPGLRPAARGRHAARDRAVLQPPGRGGRERPRSVRRRLHLRERAPCAALRHSRRVGQRVPARDPSRPRAARRTGSRQHPHPDVGGEPDLAGAARQVGHGGAPGNASAPAAAGDSGPRGDRGLRGRTHAHDPGAHGEASRQPRVQRVPPVHGPHRPGAGQLRRDREVAHPRTRHAARHPGHLLRRQHGGQPRRPAAQRSCGGRSRSSARSRPT